MFEKYADAKEMLFVKLTSGKKNTVVLNQFVGTTFCDLVVTCHLLLSDDGEQISSIAVQKDWLKVWRVDEETVVHDAIINAEKLFPACICKMSDFIGAEFVDDIPSAIIITTNKMVNGAAPDSIGIYGDDIAETIMFANNDRRIIQGNEILSDHAYHYDAAENIFESAESFECRSYISR